MKAKKTNRGFSIVEFTDDYAQACSLQKSSVATRDCIWLGVDDPKPEILARDDPNSTHSVGWVPYPIPDNVLIHTRMHLNRAQVKALLPYLQRFADTGDFEETS